MNAVEIRNLSKRYRDLTAVDGLALTVGQGELFALLGVNGAGKSTVIKMLSGLTPPTDGEAYLMGYSVREELDRIKACINVSPQETAVAPKLSVQENLELIAGLHGANRRQARESALAVMEEFSLYEVRKKAAGTLSGGWQRRLSIAMALITKPQILFLDEPTLGLDVLARRELWRVIEALHGKVTVILTTHYLEEAEALADRIGILLCGRLVAVGTAAELKKTAGEDSFENAFIKLSGNGGEER